MPSPPPSIPGFRPLSSQVFYYEPTKEKCIQNTIIAAPTTILIFGWGDALPKHLAKYTAAYQQMYPGSRIVLVLSPIMGTLYRTRGAVQRSMLPAIQLLGNKNTGVEEKILIHAFSNSGATNFIAACNAYRGLYGGQALLPHKLLILDSTPGGHNVWNELTRWSVGMAAGIGPFLPFPHRVSVFLATLWIIVTVGLPGMVGFKSVATEVCESLINKYVELTSPEAHRLLMYSREDDIIGYQELEDHAMEWSEKGWSVSLERFEGTGHVTHMRKHPEQYWKSVKDSWERAAREPEALIKMDDRGMIVSDVEKSGILVSVEAS